VSEMGEQVTRLRSMSPLGCLTGTDTLACHRPTESRGRLSLYEARGDFNHTDYTTGIEASAKER